VEEVDARSASDEEVIAAHDPAFVRAVKEIDAGVLDPHAGLEFGLGTPDDPIFPNMHRASTMVCGASLTAVEQVLDGNSLHSFNPAGGLHHARRREASGFCIYNDPAVAIAKTLEVHPDWRVLYLDVDVHHGDGVQWIFYDDPRVLTLSLHQSGRYLYPGTGFEDETGGPGAIGTAANLPLLPLTGEADYLWALERMLPTLAEAFRPDLLVTQLGADTHWNDPCQPRANDDGLPADGPLDPRDGDYLLRRSLGRHRWRRLSARHRCSEGMDDPFRGDVRSSRDDPGGVAVRPRSRRGFQTVS
jgi:acetoin utilization protein AcuC